MNQTAAPPKTNWLPIIGLLGAAAYLYLNLFAPTNTPFLLGGDQVYFWMDAQRMLHGERVYLDFFQFTPPGTELIYAMLFRVFGLRLWVTNAVVLALGLGLCSVCFAIAREIMDRAWALLTAALVIVSLYGKLLNGTHHWFSLLAVMYAVKLSMRRSDACATFATGALLGLASFFTQTRGFVALVAFFAFAVWERWRKKCPWRSTLRDLAVLAAGFISTLLLFSAHFVASAGLARLWYFQVTYVRQYFARGAHELSLGLPEPIAWRTLPRLFQYLVIYALPLFVYPIVLWRCWHERRNPAPPWRQLALLALTGLFLLLEVITGLNWLRLYTVSMPGIILFVWVTSRATNIRRYAFAALWFGVVGLAVLQTALRHIHQSAAVQLPGGTVATTPEACAKLRWISQHTEPGQFFFQAGWPGVYLPLGLRNPAYVDGVGPGVATRPEDIASTIQWLEEKRVRFILWPARLEEQHEMDNVTPLRRYLHSHYTHVQTFPDGDVIWQRR